MTAKSLRVLIVGKAPRFLNAHKVSLFQGRTTVVERLYFDAHLTRYSVCMMTAARPPSAIGNPTWTINLVHSANRWTIDIYE